MGVTKYLLSGMILQAMPTTEQANLSKLIGSSSSLQRDEIWDV